MHILSKTHADVRNRPWWTMIPSLSSGGPRSEENDIPGGINKALSALLLSECLMVVGEELSVRANPLGFL